MEAILYFLITFVIFAVVCKVSVKAMIATINRAGKTARLENLSKIDFKHDADWYRDILKEYSAAELSYIDNLEIKTKREISATLLNLCLKRKIEICENDILVIDSDLSNLKKSEKYVMEHIIDGKVKIENEGRFYIEVREEAVEDGLIEKISEETMKKRNTKRNIKNVVSIILFFGIGGIIFGNFELLNKLNDGLAMIISVFIIIGTFFGFIKMILSLGIGTLAYRLIMKVDSYERTEKGEEINKKIEGLKRYIKDYSMLSQAEKEALEIWEEYLLYSIIFDMNKTETIVKISDLIDIKYEVGKVYYEKTTKN